MSRKILFVVNNPAFFLSHRLPVALRAKEEGYEVAVATMQGEAVAQIVAHGLTHFVIPMSRSGMNPLAELRTIYALYRLYRKYRPDLVHLVTIKPVLYGGIAARLAKVKAVVYAISGLGFIFTRERKGIDWVKEITQVLYRLALGHQHSRVIIQNDNDRQILLDIGAMQASQAVKIRGSGVDVAAFTTQPEPEKPVLVTMAARLLKDKGVIEFVEAARISARNGSDIRWQLAGTPDPGNPASVTPEEVKSWGSEVTVLGEVKDIASLYARSHIVALPSYREGLPKSLVEAAACGRAVVTTDVPGCRDAIEIGKSGLLVPVKDAQKLYEAVARLAADDNLRLSMGNEGRILALEAFDIRKVVDMHLAIYEELLA
ncbi:glycosyltransferase family 4 protein [Advenella sp. RU8]|uniref:glycosyltransferase family 4 protein n=1 Tax=Advenella sp. RU8 TaxID=3399575 RepID=UPI003AAEE731